MVAFSGYRREACAGVQGMTAVSTKIVSMSMDAGRLRKPKKRSRALQEVPLDQGISRSPASSCTKGAPMVPEGGGGGGISAISVHRGDFFIKSLDTGAMP